MIRKVKKGGCYDEIKLLKQPMRGADDDQLGLASRLLPDPERRNRGPPADGEDKIRPWRYECIRADKVDVAQRGAKQRPSLVVSLLKMKPFALVIPAESFNNRIHLCVVAKLVAHQQPDPRL